MTRRRYLEQRCRAASFPGWTGFPLRRCRYQVDDRGGPKHGEVLVLNPSAEQLERWIARSCGAIVGCPEHLFERIAIQSSAQFPVAGIVLEDLRPVDGRYEQYCFRDGVRVAIDGFATGSTDAPDDQALSVCLSGSVASVTAFARIAGTTPSEYRAAGGAVDVGSDAAPALAWLDVSRALYQRAWSADENELLSAWLRANPR